MAEMIATLSDACEREFGFMATRLFRVFKNDEVQGDVTVFGLSTSTQSHRPVKLLLRLKRIYYAMTSLIYYESMADKLKYVQFL